MHHFRPGRQNFYAFLFVALVVAMVAIAVFN